MTKAEIHPGHCEHAATVRVQQQDDGQCTVEIESECQQMKLLAARIKIVDPGEESNRGSSKIRSAFHRCCHHTFCSVPSGLIRAVGIESGMNLSGDISMHFERS